jgi:hypothetical protein
MPLVKALLESQILSAFKKMQTSAVDTESAQKDLAKDLATAIDEYIKTATVIIPPGQVVVGVNAPGQIVITAFVPTPLPGATTTPGIVTGATTLPSPPAIIT